MSNGDVILSCFHHQVIEIYILITDFRDKKTFVVPQLENLVIEAAQEQNKICINRVQE